MALCHISIVRAEGDPLAEALKRAQKFRSARAFPQAIAEADRAVELAFRMPQISTSDRARALSLAARIRVEGKRLDEATVALADRAVAMARAGSSPSQNVVVEVLDTRAQVHLAMKRPALAINDLREIVRICETGNQHRKAADFLRFLVHIAIRLGHVELADTSLDKRFAYLKKSTARDDAELVSDSLVLAELLAKHNRIARADKILKRAISHSGSDDRPTLAFARAVGNLAYFYLSTKRNKAALAPQRRCLRALSTLVSSHQIPPSAARKLLFGMINFTAHLNGALPNLLLIDQELGSNPFVPKETLWRLDLAIADAQAGLDMREEAAIRYRLAVKHLKAARAPAAWLVTALSNLGNNLRSLQRPKEALASFDEALNALSAYAPGDARASRNRGTLRFNRALALFDMEDYPAAIRELEALKSSYDPVRVKEALMASYAGMGQKDKARKLAQELLSDRETLYAADPDRRALALGNIAGVFAEFKLAPEAERAIHAAKAALRQVTENKADREISVLCQAGQVYFKLNRLNEAEANFRQCLEAASLLPDALPPVLVNGLLGLASIYVEQTYYHKAQPLMERLLTEIGAREGQDSPVLLPVLAKLTGAYLSSLDAEKAARSIKRRLDIAAAHYGKASSYYAHALNTRGEYFRILARDMPRARASYLEAIAILEKREGKLSRDLFASLNNLAIVQSITGDKPGVAATAARIEDIVKATGDMPLSYHDILVIGNTARLTMRERPRRALRLLRLAVKGLARFYASGTSGVSGAIAQSSDAAAGGPYDVLTVASMVHAAWLVAQKDPARTDDLAREAFLALQRTTSPASSAIAKLGVRLAARDSRMSALVRRLQDLQLERAAKAARFELLARRGTEHARSESARMARVIQNIDATLKAVEAEIAALNPAQLNLTGREVVELSDLQSLLGDNEVLVQTFFERSSREGYLWFVTKEKFLWVQSHLGWTELAREVAALRCGLDRTTWYGDGALRCADLLGMPLDKAPKSGEALPFNTTKAHELFLSLFGKARDLIAGKQLLIVPSGPLTTLPFQVLVTKPPKSKDIASAHWMILDHAITEFPSIGALWALRRAARSSNAAKPMIGFANPLLDGDQRDPVDGPWYKEQAERARAETGCATRARQRTTALRNFSHSTGTIPQTGGLADLAHLRTQMPLPETADEICEVARSVRADTRDMRIGVTATETEVKRLSETRELADYRIVHFATHGLLAGQLSGTREPGLILTPPARATPRDDGYLSASEIAGLKLDADWVILSACNTAGGAGKGTEALSGLARAFFYAGARALLVTHWEVDSDAAVKLVTKAVDALARNKNLGRAEALRRAIRAVMADTTRPTNWVQASHPAVWAPFVVVGEGGAGR